MRLNKNLVAFVQKNEGHGWETMAGFDVDAVAAQYARDCADGATGRTKYRAMHGKKQLWPKQ